LQIQDVLAHAKDHGLDGVCITDHQSMDIRHFLQEGVQENGVCVIFGMEYSTPEGDFLVFAPIEDMGGNLSAHQLLTFVQNHGGVAIAAHPFREGRSVDEHVARDGLCHVVESVNGRNTLWENLQVDCWRQRYDLTECGGSDAHSLDELGAVKTRFFVPVRTRFDLIHALKHRLCQPEIHTSGKVFAPREGASQISFGLY
jgi:predicted metal-dependent phosphoesterase TrpH